MKHGATTTRLSTVRMMTKLIPTSEQEQYKKLRHCTQNKLWYKNQTNELCFTTILKRKYQKWQQNNSATGYNYTNQQYTKVWENDQNPLSKTSNPSHIIFPSQRQLTSTHPNHVTPLLTTQYMIPNLKNGDENLIGSSNTANNTKYNTGLNRTTQRKDTTSNRKNRRCSTERPN